MEREQAKEAWSRAKAAVTRRVTLLNKLLSEEFVVKGMVENKVHELKESMDKFEKAYDACSHYCAESLEYFVSVRDAVTACLQKAGHYIDVNGIDRPTSLLRSVAGSAYSTTRQRKL